MAKPNIDYKGKNYEFEGSLKLRREYNKEVQRINELDLTQISPKALAQAQETMKGKTDLTEEQALELFKENEELINCAIAQQKEATVKIEKLNVETAYKMLGHTKLSTKDWATIIDELDDSYEDGASAYCTSVVNFVFTQMVEEKKLKPLPTWK
ncbi:MAG: hypothetical protein R3Y05_01310 [bacterium]